jgi:MoxR-like ATPase
MPNVRGLAPAPDILATLAPNTSVAYGAHCTVSHDGTSVTLRDGTQRIVASVVFGAGEPHVTPALAYIDGDSVSAVNALLRPYGRAKAYWRASRKGEIEYRWLPAKGVTTPAVPAPAAIRPPSGHQPTLLPAEPVTVSPPVVTVHPASFPVIETMRRWQDLRKRQPVAKAITKTYSIVDDVIVPTDDVESLDFMKRQRDNGDPAFGLITGPAGTAKTRLAQAWAFTHDLPVVIVEGQSIQTAGDWFGAIIPTDHGFDWVWSDAAKLIMTGQPCAIVLDELNRPENERALNGIMGLTDWKATVKPVGAPHSISLVPGQCVIATLNEGPEYVGIVEVDAAVRDRFDAAGVRMDYATEVIEARILTSQVAGLDKEVARRLVRVAIGQRAKRDDDTQYPSHNVISTRALVTIARSVALGRDPKKAIWATVKTRFWPEDYAALNVLIEAQFGPDPEVIDDTLADDDDIENMLVAHDI